MTELAWGRVEPDLRARVMRARQPMLTPVMGSILLHLVAFTWFTVTPPP